MQSKNEHLVVSQNANEDRATLAIHEKQSQFNRSTRGQWHFYASHRAELERLLVPDRPDSRICVLGAGNCNDLDLRWLSEVYREVQLVDLDPEALARAVKFQKVAESPKIKLRGSVDLTGLADRLGTWGKNPPMDEEVKAATRLSAELPAALAAELGGPFDVVLSPCMLSQLLMPLRDTITENHPGFGPLLSAIRARHFRLMLDMLSPGGRGVLACDLLSSGKFPDLALVAKDRLPDLMGSMLAKGKCFSGLEPAAIAAVLNRDPDIAPCVGNVRSTPPWLWHLGLSKTFLVYAVTFVKRVEVGAEKTR